MWGDRPNAPDWEDAGPGMLDFPDLFDAGDRTDKHYFIEHDDPQLRSRATRRRSSRPRGSGSSTSRTFAGKRMACVAEPLGAAPSRFSPEE